MKMFNYYIDNETRARDFLFSVEQMFWNKKNPTCANERNKNKFDTKYDFK
jgi:hypothetical protein